LKIGLHLGYQSYDQKSSVLFLRHGVYFLQMHICFCVCFRFSVLSLEIGWEERLRNDLFCVRWDVKALTQCRVHCTGWDCLTLEWSSRH